jgi:small-conductance mechanosensitive channel
MDINLVYLKTVEYMIPIIIMLCALILGVFFDKYFIYKLKKATEKTKWQGDNVIVSALKGILTITFLILGLYISATYLNLNPKLADLLKKVLNSALVLIGTIAASRIIIGLININSVKIERIFPASSILQNIIKIIIFILGGLIILKTLNISITPILTALGVGGLAVALALQPTLSNLFSGLQIIASKQLKPGDYVSLDTGQEGYVEDITWRHTAIRALANNMYIIPNSKISEAIVTNYHKPSKDLSVLVQVGVSYNSDLEFVEKVTIDVGKEIMKNIPGAQSEFEPFTRYHTFSDSSINFTVILRVNEFVDQYIVKHEFVKALQKRYKRKELKYHSLLGQCI